MNKLLTPPVSENDNQTSGADVKLTLVEYGDYQCPYCGRAYPMVKRLLKEKGDEIRFVFRNFPLQTIHACALSAALAADAASRQNKFWKMHDLLFENQDQFADDLFPQLAKKLELDLARFQSDFISELSFSKVNADFESGLRSGVNGTPSFFIDGSKIHLPDLSYEALADAIDEHLNSQGMGARS